VHERAKSPPDELLAGLRDALEAHAGGQPFPYDLSIVALARRG
jgi:hypothetical protein